MNLITRINRRRRINRAIRELAALNDDTLKDIGVERGNIADLVEAMIDGQIDHRAFSARQEGFRRFRVTGEAVA